MIRIPLHPSGIESTFLITPVFRKNPQNSAVVSTNTPHGRNLGGIFDGVCAVEYVEEDKLPSLATCAALYGSTEKLRENRFSFVPKMYLETFNIPHDNYIPFMRFKQTELVTAHNRLSGFRKPICINASTGRFWMERDINKHQLMMSTDKWKIIIDGLHQNGHDVLFFTSSKCHFPLEGTIPMLDYPVREMCAMFKASGFYIGIESGMFHGAVASGAICFQLVPYLDELDKFFWPNFVYTPPMWKYESQRVFVRTFADSHDIPQILKTIYDVYR